VSLVLVGEGPERRRLASLLPRERIHFLGGLPRAQVSLAYRACDVAVLPTYREGWPNVVTETLASGLPVVASEVGGIPEILSDPELSALVPAGDEEALVQAITRFLTNPPDPAQVRGLAERYSWDEPVSRLSELFRSALL
jgi:glycosyltransferase involved in cell wall biosynthesis